MQLRSEPRHEFVTLDGLRGIAAFAVFTGHAALLFKSITAYGSVPDASGKLPAVGPFFENYLAVDFFFALSGFVLTHAYESRLLDRMSARQFMIIRLIRLYPLYLLALGLSVPLFLWASYRGWGADIYTVMINVAFAALFLPSPMQCINLFPIVPPAWSLFFELIANAVFALLARRLSMRMLWTIVAGAGLLLTLAVTMRWFGFDQHGMGAMRAGSDCESFAAGFLRVAYSFFAGVLTYRVWKGRKHTVSTPPIVVVALFIVLLSVHPTMALQGLYDIAVTIFVFPLLIFAGASAKPKRFASLIFSALGTASYAVYILHVPIYWVLRWQLPKILGMSVADVPLIGAILFTILLFLGTLALDYIYDVPVRRWLTLRLMPKTSLRSV